MKKSSFSSIGRDHNAFITLSHSLNVFLSAELFGREEIWYDLCIHLSTPISAASSSNDIDKIHYCQKH